jgi:hypothetical protein
LENDPFINQTRFEDKKRFSGRLDKELEIISSTKENKSFLLDLVLDRFVQNENPVNVCFMGKYKLNSKKNIKE